MKHTRPPRSYQLFPASPLQHHMVSECLESPAGSGVYVEQIVLECHQEVNFERFSTAWLRIVEHHEVLRIGFKQSASNRLEQYVTPLQELNIETNDWSRFPKHTADEFLDTFIQADRRLGFSPFTPPLFRISLLKLKKNRYTCILSFFSAIVDRNCLVVILKDLFSVYGNPQSSLSEPIKLVSRLNVESEPDTAINFWERLFQDIKKPMTFPFYLAQPRSQQDRRKRQEGLLTTQIQTDTISSDLTRRLNAVCQRNDITLNFLLMGAFAIMLSHYSGEGNVFFCLWQIVKKSVQHKGIGDSTNILPAKFFIDPYQTLSTFLSEIRSNCHKTNAYAQTSLSHIRSQILSKKNTDLFGIAFSFQKQCVTSIIEPYKNIISCKQISIRNRRPFSLFLSICGTDELSASFHYDRRKFDNKTILEMMGHLRTLLTGFTKDGNPTLSELPILSNQEKDALARQLNPIPMPQRPDSCIHHMFDIQASTIPLVSAVSSETGRITYGQLSDRANQIAHFLICFGVVPGSRLMLLLESDIAFIPVQIGIIKAGCIVIPISPNPSVQNLKQYVDTMLPDILITSKKMAAGIPLTKEKIIVLESALQEIDRQPLTSPILPVSPGNIAYISPSMDENNVPIGVMTPHYALISYANSAINIFDIFPTDRILFTSTDGTAPSAEQVILSLFSGATLIIGPWASLPHPVTLMDFCDAQGVTILQIHKTVWQRIVREEETALPHSLRLLIIDGNRPDPETYKRWRARIPENVKTLGTYGSKETTGAAFWSDLSDTFKNSPSQRSIGSPFPGVYLALLNRFFQPALPNTTGELYIGGWQTAQAYFNREDKTREAFRKINFPGSHIFFFKTGDHAKLTADSNLVFRGYQDSQAIPDRYEPDSENSVWRYEPSQSSKKDGQPPIILVGNSVQAAQSYKKTDRMGYPFFHAPIFIHFYKTNGHVPMNMDIPDIASECIKDIRNVYPKGPYIIIGECQNAIVAHEIAIQFTAQNQQVELLVIIDENWGAKTNHTGKKQNFIKWLEKQIHQIHNQGIGYLVRKIQAKIRGISNRGRRYLDRLNEAFCRQTGRLVPEDVQFRSMESIFYESCAASQYTPQIYNGPVLLFYSQHWLENYNSQLRHYYGGREIKQIHIDTRHDEWFKPDQIKKIIENINISRQSHDIF